MASINEAAISGHEPMPRLGHVLVEYEGCSYLVGGLDNNDQPISLSEVDIFDPTTLKWQCHNATGDIPKEISYAAYVTTKNFLYIFGGYSKKQRINALVMLDLKSLQWSFIYQRNAPSARSSAKMVADGERLLLYGGWDAKNYDLDDLHIFSIQDGECYDSPKAPFGN